jgi:hypothetical protein
LYWPYHAKPGVANYLYYSNDIWRYTFYWTIIIFGLVHLVVAAYAILMHVGKGKKAWKWVWSLPLIYLAIAAVEAVLAGIFVGLMLVVPLGMRGALVWGARKCCVGQVYGFWLELANGFVVLERSTMRAISRCRLGFRWFGHS